ncbi:MAG: GIDE domain-containing protein [Halorientalis sp.]
MAAVPLWQGLVFGGFFSLVGLGLSVAAVRQFRKAATLLRTRSASVADLDAGDLVTVSGTVEPFTDERVPAHFRNGDGVAVATRVQRTTRSGGGRTRGTAAEGWTTKRSHFATVPFAVDDGSGTVAVRPPDLEAFPTEASFRDSIRLDERTVPDEPHVVGTAPRAFDEFAFDGETVAAADADRRFEQGLLEPGDAVSVVGRVIRTEGGRLAVGAPNNTDAFTLVADDRGDASALGQSAGALVLALLGAVCTAIGGGALALAVLPRLL